MGAGWAVIFAVIGAVMYVLHKRRQAGVKTTAGADP